MDVAGSPHSSIGDNVQLHLCEVPHKGTTDHVFKMNSDGYIINQKSNYCVNVLGYKSTQRKLKCLPNLFLVVSCRSVKMLAKSLSRRKLLIR